MYNHRRPDVYTISNPMAYYSNPTMGSKPSTQASAPGEISHESWLQMNDSPISTSERNNSIMMDRKEVQEVRQRSRIKYVINGLILIFVTAIISSVEFGFLPHTQQSFRCKDPKLSYAYRGDTIRPAVLGVVCVVLPLAIFFGVEYARTPKGWRKISLAIFRWVKFLVLGNIIINLFITEVLKSAFGEHRPHFFDTCNPTGMDTCTAGEVISSYRCTNKEYSFTVITDSSRSFPSGHASLSVFTSVYCAVYIHYRLTTRSYGSVLKPFLIAIVMLWGLGCGLSRITDHRHHWWDVLSGSALGAISALFAIYGMANKFRSKPTERTSVSSTKLWDDRSKEDVSV